MVDYVLNLNFKLLNVLAQKTISKIKVKKVLTNLKLNVLNLNLEKRFDIETVKIDYKVSIVVNFIDKNGTNNRNILNRKDMMEDFKGILVQVIHTFLYSRIVLLNIVV